MRRISTSTGRCCTRRAPILPGAPSYTDWGKTGICTPARTTTLYLVSEAETALVSLHLGIGRGYSGRPERTIVKLVWSNSF